MKKTEKYLLDRLPLQSRGMNLMCKIEDAHKIMIEYAEEYYEQRMKKNYFKPTQEDWNYVKDIMLESNMSGGWVDIVEDNDGNLKLELFDANSVVYSLKDSTALYVTLDDIARYHLIHN